MSYLIPFLILFSVIFISMSNPLSMGLILFLQTMLIALMSGASTHSFWFSYILFLIFLGGMLILFIYISSLSSNNLFTHKIKFNIYLSMTLMSVILLVLIMDPIYFPTSLFSSSLYLTISPIFATKWIYSLSFKAFTLFIIMYLLITLVVVVKISSMMKGPLRPLN